MTVEDIAARLWTNRLARDPVGATLMGFHQHDSELPDLSDEAIAALASELRGIARDAESIDTEDLGQQDRITRDLAIHEAEVTAESLEGRYLLGAVDTFIGPPSALLISVNSLSAADMDQAEAYARRWTQVPAFLEQALRLNREEAEKGRPPARIVVERVINGIDGYLASELDDDPFLKATLPKDAGDEFSDRLRTTVEEIIRPAYQAYRDNLIETVLPASRPDDRAGLKYISDGEEVYRKLIEMYTSLQAVPQELHEYGMTDATEKLPDEWANIGQRALGISDMPTLFDRLRNDPELSYRSTEEMVKHAEKTVERAWAAIDGWFGARPETQCSVREVPESIAADLPPAYYLAPSEDGSRPGTYFLNTYEPASRKRFNYESIHFHEAIPGHHFDRSLSVELKGIPEFRRHFASFAHAEGWGLYSERLADEMELYSTDLDRLGMLAADAWRAGRLVVDTGLHHMGWSRDQAIEWFLAWTPIPQLVVEQEVDRYIGMPGQALSYKTGQREISRLREKAVQTLGTDFSHADFHDAILTSGGLTLPVLAGVVEEWLAGA